MSETQTLLTLGFLASGVASFSASFSAWRQRIKPTAIPLACAGICAGVWAVCYALELASPSMEAKLFWLTVKSPAVNLLPLAFAAFLLRFAGWRDWPGPRTLAALLIMPVLFSLVSLTNSLHHLYWTDFELIQGPGFVTINAGQGPWFWATILYSYSLLTAVSAVAISNMTRMWRYYRRQILMVAIGFLIPVSANLISTLGWLPIYHIDLSPASLGLSALFLLLTTNLIGWMDVAPLAYAVLAEQISDGLLITDDRGLIVDLNKACESLLERPRGELIGRNLKVIEHPALAPLRQLSDITAQREIRIGAGEQARWYELRLTPVAAPDGKPAGQMAIWHEITRRKQVEVELRYASTHDQLTGLHNRMYFEEEFERAGRGRAWPVALLIGDLDNLKETNDRQGHPAGDQLLRHTANVFRACLRGGDMLARIGGDEFAVVLPACDQRGVEGLVRRLDDAVQAHNRSTPDLPIEISLGYAVAEDKTALEHLFQQADERMYANKRERKA